MNGISASESIGVDLNIHAAGLERAAHAFTGGFNRWTPGGPTRDVEDHTVQREKFPAGTS